MDSGKSVLMPLTQGQEAAPVSYRRGTRNPLSDQPANVVLPPLKLGQELEAVVVEELVGGRLLLKLGGIVIEAENPGGLRAGQHIRVRVEQLQPQVVLHVTDTEIDLQTEALRLLRSCLPAYADSGELLDNLYHKLASFLDATHSTKKLAELRDSIGALLVSAMSLTSQEVEMWARNGGLFYEAKILQAAVNNDDQLLNVIDHDLKGLLVAALQESKAGVFTADLHDALSAQLENLEAQQASNLLAQLDGALLRLQIPFFTGTRFSTAVVAVEPDGDWPEEESHNEKHAYLLLFLLDLENFGRTRIEAHVEPNGVRAVFFLEDEGSLSLIRRELPGFREILMAIGYEYAALAARPLRDLPADKRDKFAALAAGAPSSIHLLNLTA